MSPLPTPRYAPALYRNRTLLRWYLRMLRFRLKHGATLRGAWWDARETRRIQKAMPSGKGADRG